MKITEVQSMYPRYRVAPAAWRRHFWQMVVRVDTDVGISGWGAGGGGIAAVEVINRHLRELLVGRSINSIEDVARLWDDQYKASLPYGRSGVAVMAISGVDSGAVGCPWAGPQKSPSAICWAVGGGTRCGPTPQAQIVLGIATWALMPISLRRRSEKAKPLTRRAYLSGPREARQTLGKDALLMIDAYMSWSPDFAVAVAQQLAPFKIHWFEDVLLPDDLDGLAALRPQIHPVLLAGGEHEFTARDFGHIARIRALDLWQPDVTWCGGLTAALRIAELAQAHGVPLVPHRGGEIWGLHFLAAGYGDNLAEMVMGRRGEVRDKLWLGEPQPQGGHLVVPEGPGFGVKVNGELL